MFRKTFVAGASALALLGGLVAAAPAQAYPAGQLMNVAVSVTGNAYTGAVVSAKAYHVLPGCNVDFKLVRPRNNVVYATDSAVAGSLNSTPLVTLQAPAVADLFQVTAKVTGCAAMTDRKTAYAFIQVGRVNVGVMNAYLTINSQSGLPMLKVVGKVYTGPNGYAYNKASIRVTLGKKYIGFKYVPANSAGKFIAYVSPTTYVKPGRYKVVAIVRTKNNTRSLTITDYITIP